MDNLKNAMIFASCDGDGIGQKVGRAALADNEQELNTISQHIEAGNQVVRDFCNKNGGQVISSGGDELSVKLPLKAAEELEKRLRADYSFTVGATLTIGVGESLSQSSKALIVGKLRGKDQICQYDDSVEQEYQQATQEANAKDPIAAEKEKIGKEYMKDPQKSQKGQSGEEIEGKDPKKDTAGKEDAIKAAGNTSAEEAEESGQDNDKSGQESGHDDDCPYCTEESGQAELEGDDCPYCAESDQEDSSQQDDLDDCSHCEELDQQNPQSGDPRLSVGDEASTPDSITAPAMEEDGPGGQNAFDGTPSEKESLAEAYPGKDSLDTQNLAAAPMADGQPAEPFSEEHKSPEEVLSEFDELHGEPSEEGDSKYEKIDDTGIAESDKGQEQNVSRPDDFNEEIKTGSEDPNNTDGSEEPDYSQVMQDDMGMHQDDIAKEKVGNMVREALMNFKNTKDYLEQAQQQAPDFYAANVSLIRALIEAAKLLGFGGQSQDDGQQAQPELGQEESAMIPEQQAPKADMTGFPKHPDQGGEPKDEVADGTKPPERKQSDWSDPFPKHPEASGGGMDNAKAKKQPAPLTE